MARAAHDGLPKVDVTTWRNFLVPALLSAQLLHGWRSSAVWTVCAGLASYAVDLAMASRMTAETRKKMGYTTSILLHHTVTVAVIGWLLLTWAPDVLWGTKWVLLRRSARSPELPRCWPGPGTALARPGQQDGLHHELRSLAAFASHPPSYLWFPYWTHKALYTILMGPWEGLGWPCTSVIGFEFFFKTVLKKRKQSTKKK